MYARYLKILFITLLTIMAGRLSAQETEHDPSIDSLRSVLDTMPDGFDKLKTMFALTYQQMQIDSIRKYSRMGIELSKKLDCGLYEGENYRFMAWSYTVTGELDSAKHFYAKAAEKFEEIDSLTPLAFTYYGLSELEEMENHITEAIEYTMQMARIGERTNKKTLTAMAYQRLGVIYNILGATAEAAEYIDKAIEINRSIGNLMQLGSNYREKATGILKSENKFSKITVAKDLLLTARDCYTQADDEFDIIYTDNMLGEAYIALSRLSTQNAEILRDSALYYYHSGKRICNKIGQHYFDNNLNIVYLKYMILSDQLCKARQMLDSIQESPSYDHNLKNDFRNTNLMLYKAEGNWKMALATLDSINYQQRLTIIKEYDVKITKETSSNEYYHKMMQKEQEHKERMEQQRREQIFSRRIRKISAAILLISIMVLTTLIVRYINKNITNKKLSNQKNRISQANNELNIRNEEILAQNEQIEKQTKELEEQTRILIKANKNMVRNLESAQMIQSALMPSREKLRKMFGEMLIYWKPLHIVSGDFYWAAEVLGHKLIAAADCTGHGVPGALMSTLGLTSLNQIISGIKHTGKMLSPAEILRQLRKMVVSRIDRPADRYEDSINDGMDIALCVFGPNDTLQYTGAKRPLWLMRDGKITQYRADRITVGPDTLGERTEFTNTTIELKKGDLIYLFSDGITDQQGMPINGKRKKYQSAQLKETLEKISSENFDNQWFHIDTSLQQWMGPAMQQTDDLLLLGIRVN